MPIYHSLGQVPPKRHTVFRKPNGELYAEELVSTEGFSSLYSLVYHTHPPTLVKSLGEAYSVEPKIAREKHLRHTSLIGFNIKPEDDFLKSRKPVLVNSDLHISLAAPRKSMTDYFYKNSQNKTLIKQDRRQRLKDAQDQYNKAFGIETEDKLTEFENIK
jgi:homogentisate 1,2-dioxygenase